VTTNVVSGEGQVAPLRILAWPAEDAKNPYITLLYDSLRKIGAEVSPFSPLAILAADADIWHIHWPDRLLNVPSLSRAVLRVGAMIFLLRIARLRGFRIVWTVHNLGTHEGYHPQLERWFWNRFSEAVHGFIALTRGGKLAAEARFPALRRTVGFVVAHGHYRGFYPDTVTREQARESLELPAGARVMICLGHLRGYKNIPRLVDLFSALPDSDARLVIAGEPTPVTIGDSLVRIAEPDRRVRIVLGFIAPEQIQLYLRATDLMVLPYRELLNSGTALLALSFGCPLLVPQRGAMEELASIAGSAWVRMYSGDLTTSALAEALDWATAIERGPYCDTIAGLNWTDVAKHTLEALVAIAGRSERQPRNEGAAPKGFPTFQ
jgi:glycosyltransferase involved in cell wall biosynthesis